MSVCLGGESPGFPILGVLGVLGGESPGFPDSSCLGIFLVVNLPGSRFLLVVSNRNAGFGSELRRSVQKSGSPEFRAASG